MRYYEQEHFDAYARIRREGHDQWNDLHDSDRGRGFDDFSNRSFLDRMLPVDGGGSSVLEYGCGTGPAACFLAARGYRVHAVDLVPDAIEVARVHAAERGLPIRFGVEDVCRWGGEPTERYDYVVDSFCLQSIVTDEDRSRLLDGVRKRLEPRGRYLISTAMYAPDREYGDNHYDGETGIVWTPVTGPTEDGMILDGSWYVPNRRHLTASALRAELEGHGYRVIEQSQPSGGDVVCEKS